jgi:hypothetical protein
MMMGLIRVADFAPSPGGRYIADGPYSGEWFRDEVLVGRLREAARVGIPLEVELDDTAGYGASFLEEAFGGLVRHRLFIAAELDRILQIVARRPLYAPYKALAEKYIADAKPETVAA